jgi:hypothetical protein
MRYTIHMHRILFGLMLLLPLSASAASISVVNGNLAYCY